MTFILFFLGVFSAILGSVLTAVYINVVVRRESAYLIEARINAITASQVLRDFPQQTRIGVPEQKGNRFVLSSKDEDTTEPTDNAEMVHASNLPNWLRSANFQGLIVDGEDVEVLSLRPAVLESRGVVVERRLPLNRTLLRRLVDTAGLDIADFTSVPVWRYRQAEGFWGEMLANFIPGFQSSVPVIVSTHDWETGRQIDWVVCRIRLSYRHTFRDLSRMGLHTSAWLLPLLVVSLCFLAIHAAGVLTSFQFGRRIVSVIDALTSATNMIGRGDLTVRVASSGKDQLGTLAASFNNMADNLETLRAQERQAITLERELSLASEVQNYFTPTKHISCKDCSIWSTSTPARHVSGDLHEVVQLNGSTIGMMCADISGKGASSALIMAHVQGFMHAFLKQCAGPVTPSALAEVLNSTLNERFKQRRYATMFYGEYNAETGILTYVNAGHCPPLLLVSGQATSIQEGNIPLGLFPQTKYIEHQFAISPGATLVLYTDGVTDALNRQGEQMGDKRFEQLCKSIAEDGNAEHIGERLRDEIKCWSAQVEQFDDATLMVLHRDPLNDGGRLLT